MAYYSVIKRDELLVHDATWMDLNTIMASEISMTKRLQVETRGLFWNEGNVLKLNFGNQFTTL